MAAETLPGYRGKLRELLTRAKVGVGDAVRVHTRGESYEGTLLPRVENADEWHIVIKQKTGYNIGIAHAEGLRVEKIGEAIKPEFRPPPLPPVKEGLPKVSIISTGGTIASRVDYVTGGVYAAMSSRDLLSIVPELADIAQIEADILYSVFSENINSDHWEGMAKRVAEKIRQGADGVIITHGTDTMGYSTAALSLAIRNLPVPVIFVGSQRSSDRPSSDSATNLVAVVNAAAHAPFAEVVLGMHEGTGDDSIIFHPGAKVRKCHSSARYAFQTVNASPMARFKDGKFEMIAEHYRTRQKSEPLVMNRFEKKVALIKFHPNFDPLVVDALVDAGFRGIVFEGTGLGHVSETCYDAIGRAGKAGVLMGMTSQCIWGRVNMNVYSMGRELTRRGVEPLEDMLPETAYVKMMWSLGNSETPEEARRLLKENVAGEYNPRTPYARREP
ncbi:MAG: Glu-tRNA(Gln) amidotransferase subunit GatD [Candidatus Bathyarchaeota archaeon]|nr:Glu-tRNA(Gln) amidotransferase subunit GatD [Candidatus Bathyarchaeota archaeon]